MKLSIFGKREAGLKTVVASIKAMEGPNITSKKSSGNVVTVKVPDERVDKLSEIFKPKKINYSSVVFAFESDIAQGNKISESVFNAVRDSDALAIVVKAYKTEFDIEEPAPLNDLNEILSDMIISDLVVVEKRLEKILKQGSGGREAMLMEKIKSFLDAETPLLKAGLDENELKEISSFAFLTLKPFLVVFNITEDDIGNPFDDYKKAVEQAGGESVTLCALVEAQIAELPAEDRPEFLKEMGIEMPSRNLLIQGAYRALNLISFLTVGEDEVRSWPVRRDSKAPKAASVIHSDIERGFIRAETIAYNDFIDAGSMAEARKKGTLRLEGKEYIVKDGDIISFRFKV